MKRTAIALLACSMIVACGPDVAEPESSQDFDVQQDDSDDPQQQDDSDDPQQQDDSDDPQQQDDSDDQGEQHNPADQQDGEDPTDYAETMTDVMAGFFTLYNDGIAHACVCDPGDFDHPDEQTCQDEETFTDSDLDEAMSCVEDAIDEIDDEPPAGTFDDFTTCFDETVAEGDDCLQSVEEDHDQICSAPAGEQFEACFDELESNFGDCEDLMNPALDEWFDELDNTAETDGCFETVGISLDG